MHREWEWLQQRPWLHPHVLMGQEGRRELRGGKTKYWAEVLEAHAHQEVLSGTQLMRLQDGKGWEPHGGHGPHGCWADRTTQSESEDKFAEHRRLSQGHQGPLGTPIAPWRASVAKAHS